MRIFKPLIITLAACMVFVASFAISETLVDQGQRLFNDPSFAGGKKACNDCHIDGRGLEGAASKESFGVMGQRQRTLEDVVNFCIENASGGKPIAKTSPAMKAIVEYIKSLAPVNTGVRG